MYIVRQLVVSLPQWKLLPWNLLSIVSSHGPESVKRERIEHIGRIYGLRRWVHLPNIPIYQKVLSQKQIVFMELG